MKKIAARILVGVVILAILFSPYLLVIDFIKFSPLVLIIWFLTFAYYLFLRRRVQQRLDEKAAQENGEGEAEELK
jgi:Ca2+/Na+ antiporter